MNTTMALSRLHHIVRELLEGRLESTSIELLDEFVEIVRFYESGDDSVRASIRAAIDLSESSALLSLSTLCVVAAVSRCRTDLIDGAMVAHSIEDFRLDPRDNLRVLAIVWYGAERLGVDPAQILRRVAAISSSRSRAFLEQFAGRSPSSRSLSAMGLEVDDDGQLRFRPRTARGKKGRR
jgi:hypothetical protein